MSIGGGGGGGGGGLGSIFKILGSPQKMFIRVLEVLCVILNAFSILNVIVTLLSVLIF